MRRDALQRMPAGEIATQAGSHPRFGCVELTNRRTRWSVRFKTKELRRSELFCVVCGFTSPAVVTERVAQYSVTVAGGGMMPLERARSQPRGTPVAPSKVRTTLNSTRRFFSHAPSLLRSSIGQYSP